VFASASLVVAATRIGLVTDTGLAQLQYSLFTVIKVCMVPVSVNCCCDFCSDVGIYDRVVIQELLKNVAQSHQLDSSSQRDFKG